ncbi:hypothetical protein SDC9_146202 [bioreactor metagenome]|uniref:Two component regulator three Y domain-containing protein n=1 Tax=bioreactor metagenome TaxID=1076179 RepID=A0A645EEI4_9ZZZZ
MGNQFLWSIADLDPAKYTVDIEVTNGVTTATRSIDFQLYSMTNIDYGVINNMTLEAPNGALSITPTYANGSFSYRLGEPGRAPIYRSVETTNTGAINHPNTLAPGVYRVLGLATRLGVIGSVDSFDDGIVRTVTVGRPGGGSKTMTLTANPGVNPEVAKGTAIQFTANATIGGASDIQYSFWRYDAKGYVLIKDWSSSNTLDWTPARIGIYTIEARAKGSDAGSFEVIRNMVVNVTDNTEQIAQVTNITLNTEELNGAQARRPVQLKANATSLIGENLLYKFHMEDEFLGVYQLQGYSANQNCVWTPRKPGTYTVHVLLKNEHSFGRYDAKESFEITVN